MSWAKLCFPKNEGGMGFRELDKFNDSWRNRSRDLRLAKTYCSIRCSKLSSSRIAQSWNVLTLIKALMPGRAYYKHAILLIWGQVRGLGMESQH